MSFSWDLKAGFLILSGISWSFVAILFLESCERFLWKLVLEKSL